MAAYTLWERTVRVRIPALRQITKKAPVAQWSERTVSTR